jgi:hypothetical protein
LLPPRTPSVVADGQAQPETQPANGAIHSSESTDQP